MPIVASGVDQFALAFGRANLRVVWAKEGEHEIGQPSAAGVRLADTLVGQMALKKGAGRD